MSFIRYMFTLIIFAFTVNMADLSDNRFFCTGVLALSLAYLFSAAFASHSETHEASERVKDAVKKELSDDV